MTVRQIETKYYLFRQNNSGGDLVQDENFDQFVAIENLSPEGAYQRLLELGASEHYSCSCCGDRWDYCPDKEYSEVGDIINEPHSSIYDNFKIIIHFMDGTKREIPTIEITNLWKL